MDVVENLWNVYWKAAIKFTYLLKTDYDYESIASKF